MLRARIATGHWDILGPLAVFCPPESWPIAKKDWAWPVKDTYKWKTGEDLKAWLQNANLKNNRDCRRDFRLVWDQVSHMLGTTVEKYPLQRAVSNDEEPHITRSDWPTENNTGLNADSKNIAKCSLRMLQSWCSLCLWADQPVACHHCFETPMMSAFWAASWLPAVISTSRSFRWRTRSLGSSISSPKTSHSLPSGWGPWMLFVIQNCWRHPSSKEQYLDSRFVFANKEK